MHGRIMGHAGAFTVAGEPDAAAKIAALKDAGATVINHPAKFGEVFKAKLRGRLGGQIGSGTTSSSIIMNGGQRRQFHTAKSRPWQRSQLSVTLDWRQRRNLYVAEDKSMDLLRGTGQINCGKYSGHGEQRFLAIGIDRASRSPCIMAAPTIEEGQLGHDVKRYPFDYRRGPDELAIERVASHLGLGTKGSAVESLRQVLKGLVSIFYEKEAFLLTTHIVERLGAVKVVGARFGFDDAAFRSCGRQRDLQELRDLEALEASEIDAEKSGIVYLKLEGDGNIGTLVNGAGLAMNTVDALADAGGKAANFLDTGGKATSQTVKESFEIILRDPRVKVIFVNIFGGLTLGDMIARGIIMAFQDLAPRVPVVVRIRGTNEKEGQQLIADSGLPLFAYDDFEEAAAKAIELSRA